MGIYYKTVFYKDYNNKTEGIVLAQMDQILDNGDMKQGFVSKTDLLRIFKTKVQETDITENSMIVEYVSTTYEDCLDIKENKKLPVK